MGKVKQSQDQTQTTQQTDNRVGVSELGAVGQGGSTVVGAGGSLRSSAIDVRGGGDVVFENLDADVVADALGVTRDVALRLAEFQSRASETAITETAKAFDRFGTDLSAVTERVTLAQQTDGATERNKVIMAGLAVVALIGGLWVWKRK